ncbi:MAG: two-component system sensor histidine kinase CreC [Methylococcaceae bacterium]
MSKRNRIFLGVLLLFTSGVGILLYTVAEDLDTRYRESAEETLVDTAYLLAAWLETDSTEPLIDASRMSLAFERVYKRTFTAQIYAITKHHVDLRVYITDANGIVVFDSLNQETGRDFRSWRDVNKALAGQYGARTTRTDPKNPQSAFMYVAVPITINNKIIGAVSVRKSVASQQELVATVRQKLISVGVIAVMAFLFMLIIVSIWLTSPTLLMHDLIQVFRQEKIAHPRRMLRRFRTVLKGAFYDMRDAMAGRSYTEEYIQALTHELKSPLTAIRGAAELLREPMPEAQRARFTDTINMQVQRLQNLADRLLELASLEKRRNLDDPHPIHLNALTKDVLQGLELRARHKKITFILEANSEVSVLGESFLLQRALINLIENALDFSPLEGEISVTLTCAGKLCQIHVRDGGPGIPEYALDRIFEKFYSLRRPDSGQKSTGLGLPFVREIAHLHGGEVVLANHTEGGAIAIFTLPFTHYAD